ncbi:MAG: AI-2E family transporter [Nostocaceae cyanobacterium]|nr:AI-2E family transporter [Nostocaceae cyanobacterium]
MNEPQTKSLSSKLNNSQLIRYLLFIGLGWSIVQILRYFQTALVIFIFAAVIAFLLSYPVGWLSLFLPHGLAVILVFLLSLLLLGGFIATIGFSLLSQAQQLIGQFPQLLDNAISAIEQLQTFLNNRNLPVDFGVLEQQLRNQVLSGIGFSLTTFQGILGNLLDLIIIVVVALFMLLDGNRLWNFVLKIFPISIRSRLTEAIRRNFLGFFWGRLLLSLFFGVSGFIVFIILGVPYPLILAAIAGVFDLIPGIGATLGIGLVFVILLGQGMLLSVKVLIGCVLLQQLEENLLMPRIMEGSVNMNPVVMFFALLVGARVAGLIGVFLSIPIAGVLISLFDIEEMRGE